MTSQRYLRLATPLATLGVLFSGFLSGVRLLTNQCALSEPCPFFLGYPACYTGFALFAVLLIASASALVLKAASRRPAQFNGVISLLGVVFAGRMTLTELVSPTSGVHYALGLPTCAYGLVFFLAILMASGLALTEHGSGSHPVTV